MRERIRILIAACFYYTGLVKLALWWMQRSGRYLIILNYHRAVGPQLRRQILYLRRHYRILHLEDALEECFTPRHEVKQASDRRMPLVLTFDDGYRDNYTVGLPLVQELQVPITIFLIPGYIDSSKRFWWLEGRRVADNTQVDEVTVEGKTYHPGLSEEREALARAIDTRLRYAKSVLERETFLADICKTLAVPSTVTVEEENAMPMTWAEVSEMQESGWVSFGAHTMHHPILAYLSDPAEVQYEVRECRKVLEEHLGHSVRTFAYPIGKLEHIGNEALQAVKAAGYQWAVTTLEEKVTSQTAPYELCRLPGDINQHWLVMASELVGLLGILSRLRKNYEKFSTRRSATVRVHGATKRSHSRSYTDV